MGVAVLKRLALHLNNNVDIVLRNVRVVKDGRRHVVRLVASPCTIVLCRDRKRTVRAFSDGIGLFGVVPVDPRTGETNLPEFIVRLLS